MGKCVRVYLPLSSTAKIILIFSHTHSGQATAAEATSSHQMFEVQVVTSERFRGAPSRWTERFRFKHVPTGGYLAVVEVCAFHA
jgi:hypothetical protein